MKTFGRREVQQLFCVIIIFFKSDFNKLLFFFIFAQKTVIWFFIGLIWLFLCFFVCYGFVSSDEKKMKKNVLT